MPQTASDLQTFFREFRRNFHSTGSILPSSRFLAMELARFIRDGREEANGMGRAILEVGPGTGSVTDSIVAAMGPRDRLDLVELNDDFVATLRRRFDSEPRWAAVADRVRIRHQPIEAVDGEHQYDLIVSGLPLNNFAVADVERILTALARLTRPGGRLSYFEYFAIRTMRSLVSSASERARLRGIGAVTGRLLAEKGIRHALIWMNVPPARVHHVQF